MRDEIPRALQQSHDDQTLDDDIEKQQQPRKEMQTGLLYMSPEKRSQETEITAEKSGEEWERVTVAPQTHTVPV